MTDRLYGHPQPLLERIVQVDPTPEHPEPRLSWRPVESRADLLAGLKEQGWGAAFIPPTLAQAMSAFEQSPNPTTALHVESAANSIALRPFLRVTRVAPKGIEAGAPLVPLLNPQVVTAARLTREEAQAVLRQIDELYRLGTPGTSAENVFSWGEHDTLADPATRAWAKLFRAAGRPVPTKLELESGRE